MLAKHRPPPDAPAIPSKRARISTTAAVLGLRDDDDVDDEKELRLRAVNALESIASSGGEIVKLMGALVRAHDAGAAEDEEGEEEEDEEEEDDDYKVDEDDDDDEEEKGVHADITLTVMIAP